MTTEACSKCLALSEGSGCQQTDCPQRAARMEAVAAIATEAISKDPNIKIIGDFNFLTHVEGTLGRVMTEDEVEEALRVRSKALAA
jgi:hypothetical protein